MTIIAPQLRFLLRAGISVYITFDTREGAADADSEADLDAPGSVQPQ